MEVLEFKKEIVTTYRITLDSWREFIKTDSENSFWEEWCDGSPGESYYSMVLDDDIIDFLDRYLEENLKS